jgi:hypothetical protein
MSHVAGRARTMRGLRKLFEAGQRVGVDILPRHFYSAIPDVRALRRTSDWRGPRSLDAVQGADIDSQVRAFAGCFTDEIRHALGSRDVYADACRDSGAIGYGPVEADVLFAFIAHHKPPRIVQVGAGVSTAVLLAAATFVEYEPQIICIDPYPTEFLRVQAEARHIELIDRPAQSVPASDLADVGNGGLLFVDSTHTVKPGSEVNTVVLEVLPRLPSGARAHFHDITLPYDYSANLLDDAVFFWNETALLLAYLTANPRAAIHFSLSMLQHSRTPALGEAVARYKPAPFEDGIRVGAGDFPSSTYIDVL